MNPDIVDYVRTVLGSAKSAALAGVLGGPCVIRCRILAVSVRCEELDADFQVLRKNVVQRKAKAWLGALFSKAAKYVDPTATELLSFTGKEAIRHLIGGESTLVRPLASGQLEDGSEYERA